jgi:hypothetical protein
MRLCLLARRGNGMRAPGLPRRLRWCGAGSPSARSTKDRGSPSTSATFMATRALRERASKSEDAHRPASARAGRGRRCCSRTPLRARRLTREPSRDRPTTPAHVPRMSRSTQPRANGSEDVHDSGNAASRRQNSRGKDMLEPAGAGVCDAHDRRQTARACSLPATAGRPKTAGDHGDEHRHRQGAMVDAGAP